MFGQQITGQAFSSQYSVIFYQQQGFQSQAFLFGVINNVVGIVSLFIAWFLVDGVGRRLVPFLEFCAGDTNSSERPLIMIGGFLMGAFYFIIAGVSSNAHPNQAERHAMVCNLFSQGEKTSMLIMTGRIIDALWSLVLYLMGPDVSFVDGCDHCEAY
jgi:SP family sugar:H+ symporter-like MFS transporter